MEQNQSQEPPAEQSPQQPAAEESNGFTLSIPGRGATNFVIFVGVVSVVLLLVHGTYDVVRDAYLFDHTDPAPDLNEFIILIVVKAIIFYLFPLLALNGIIFSCSLRIYPSLIKRYLFQPVFLLIPTIFPLGYHWLMSIFQMINSLTVLADEIFNKNSWLYVLFSTMQFLLLLFSLSWYYVLIQVVFGQYKIARELNSTNSTRIRTTIPHTPILPPPPPQLSPSHPSQSQTNVNILENDIYTDSSETPLSPFSV